MVKPYSQKSVNPACASCLMSIKPTRSKRAFLGAFNLPRGHLFTLPRNLTCISRLLIPLCLQLLLWRVKESIFLMCWYCDASLRRGVKRNIFPGTPQGTPFKEHLKERLNERLTRNAFQGLPLKERNSRNTFQRTHFKKHVPVRNPISRNGQDSNEE